MQVQDESQHEVGRSDLFLVNLITCNTCPGSTDSSGDRTLPPAALHVVANPNLTAESQGAFSFQGKLLHVATGTRTAYTNCAIQLLMWLVRPCRMHIQQ